MANYEVLPIDDWFAGTPMGDVALCSPFNGEPLNGNHIRNEPVTPPSEFVTDFNLGNGYGYWIGSKHRNSPLLACVCLTDPQSRHGLGDINEFRDLAGNFDVVALDPTPSVRMEHIRRARDGIGNLVMHNGVMVDETYLAALSESHNLVVNIAPNYEAETGRYMTPAGRALREIRTQVEFEAMGQDQNNPDLAVLAGDYVYANTSQWHQAMAAGLIGDGYYLKHGRPMNSILILTSHENGDLGRKLVRSGSDLETTFVEFATEQIKHDENTHSYAEALARGYIPHEDLQGAEF